MTLCQICFWLARRRPHWTHSDPLLPRTHLPKPPQATCTESLLVLYVSGWESVYVCVCGWPRVWGMSVVVTISVSVRANVSFSSEIRDVIGFWASLWKKTPKAPHPQTKHKFGERRKTRQGCQCCPPTQRTETRRDEMSWYRTRHSTGTVTYTQPFVVPGYYFVLHIITDYVCCTPAAESWHPNPIAV